MNALRWNEHSETEDVGHRPEHWHASLVLHRFCTLIPWYCKFLQHKLKTTRETQILPIYSWSCKSRNRRYYPGHCFLKHSWRPAKYWGYFKAEEKEESLSMWIYASRYFSRMFESDLPADANTCDSYFIYIHEWGLKITREYLNHAFFKLLNLYHIRKKMGFDHSNPIV